MESQRREILRLLETWNETDCSDRDTQKTALVGDRWKSLTDRRGNPSDQAVKEFAQKA
jgi:hypothetical protein